MIEAVPPLPDTEEEEKDKDRCLSLLTDGNGMHDSFITKKHESRHISKS